VIGDQQSEIILSNNQHHINDNIVMVVYIYIYIYQYDGGEAR
jgi:hypothetical protein